MIPPTHYDSGSNGQRNRLLDSDPIRETTLDGGVGRAQVVGHQLLSVFAMSIVVGGQEGDGARLCCNRRLEVADSRQKQQQVPKESRRLSA